MDDPAIIGNDRANHSDSEPRSVPAKLPSDMRDKDWIIGKHPFMHLKAWQSRGRTRAEPVRCRTPYQWLGCHYQDADDEPFIPLVNTAGGYVEGDRSELHIDVYDGARTLVTTTNATKYYKSFSGGVASERTTIRLGHESLVEYVPDEAIPFGDSRIDRRSEIYLRETSRLFLGDILSAGRVHYGQGETFEFASLLSTLNIYVEGQPLMMDRINARNSADVAGLQRLWHGYNHLLSVTMFAPSMPNGLVDEIRRRIRNSDGIGGASSKGNLLSVRALLPATWKSHDLMYEIWGEARPWLAGKPAGTILKP